MDYEDKVRTTIGSIERHQIEALLLSVVLRYYCGSLADAVPLSETDELNGADLVDDLSYLLRAFRP